MAGDLYGDYSRISFEKDISALLSQQGRVILDSEINEQASVLLALARMLGIDVLGRFGGPDLDPATAKGAHGPFLIAAGTAPSGEDDLTIGAGRYYVGGI